MRLTLSPPKSTTDLKCFCSSSLQKFKLVLMILLPKVRTFLKIWLDIKVLSSTGNMHFSERGCSYKFKFMCAAVGSFAVGNLDAITKLSKVDKFSTVLVGCTANRGTKHEHNKWSSFNEQHFLHATLQTLAVAQNLPRFSNGTANTWEAASCLRHSRFGLRAPISSCVNPIRSRYDCEFMMFFRTLRNLQ